MKKVLCLLAFSAVMFAGCQEDWEAQQEGTGEESMVRITLQTPEAMGMTRAGAGYTNSAKGGITNVDWNKYDLRYQVAVYDKDGKTQIVSPKVVIVPDASTATDASFEVRLVNKRTYKFVAWADFVKEGTTADNHYDTSDLTNITCKDETTAQLNDESRDAYFVTTNEEVSTDGVSLTLRRPFAKVRIVTTDWNANDPERRPNKIDIAYYGCKRFEGINAVTGAALEGENSSLPSWTDSKLVHYTTVIDPDAKDYSAGYDGGEDGTLDGAQDVEGEEDDTSATSTTTEGEETGVAEDYENRTLMVDYLIASPKQTSIKIWFKAFDGNKHISGYRFSTDIPIQRNYLTTLLGNLLTENIKVTMICDENFEEEFNDFDNDGQFVATKPQFAGNVVYIKTPGELVWLAQNALTDQASKNTYFDMSKDGPARGNGGYIFKLENDLDMEGVKWTPINWWPANDTGSDEGVFDGQGHTIRNLKIESSKLGSQGLFGATTINVKDLTIENATFNNVGPFTGTIAGNSYGDFENCTVRHIFIRSYDYATPNPPIVYRIGGMVGIHNGGNMKNCTAKDVNVKGYHSVGGLTGFVNETPTRKYENCQVTDSHLWNTASSGAGGKQIGAIVGVADVSLTLKDCSSANMEYKIGPYNEENGTPYIMVSGEEGTKEYGPQHALYGNPNNITVEYSDSNSEP